MRAPVRRWTSVLAAVVLVAAALSPAVPSAGAGESRSITRSYLLSFDDMFVTVWEPVTGERVYLGGAPFPVRAEDEEVTIRIEDELDHPVGGQWEIRNPDLTQICGGDNICYPIGGPIPCSGEVTVNLTEVDKDTRLLVWVDGPQEGRDRCPPLGMGKKGTITAAFE